MAVLIVEPHDGYATWLASALSGLTDRVVRAAGPDEAMAAMAAEGRSVLAAIFGPSLHDQDALALAGAVQQGTPDVSVLLIRRQDSGELLRQALRMGVKDVLSSASDETAVRTSAARAIEIARALRGRLSGGAPTNAGNNGEGRAPGRVVTVFSSKGGCGKTFLSTNLAVALSRGGAEVALVDLDLHFGDVAIMLHLFPSHTIYDAAQSPTLDALTLKSFLTHHESGIWALVAPTEPTIADTMNPATIGGILKLLRSAFDYVVIDTPPAFSEPVLAAFDESDWLVMLATLDVPSIKNLKLTLQTMELLHFPKDRVRVVVNRADSKVGLRMPDVEKLLSAPVDTTIPSSRSVPLSVNKGSPIMLEDPKGPVAEAIRRIATQLIEAKPTGRPKQRQRRSLFNRS
jgi:pilus assembly protein CpaE